jgi:hypothetical protein
MLDDITKFLEFYVNLYIVPGGKVKSSLGGNSISPSKQIIVYVHVPYSEVFRGRSFSFYSSKTIDKKKVLRTVPNIVQSDKVGTVYLV